MTKRERERCWSPRTHICQSGGSHAQRLLPAVAVSCCMEEPFVPRDFSECWYAELRSAPRPPQAELPWAHLTRSPAPSHSCCRAPLKCASLPSATTASTASSCTTPTRCDSSKCLLQQQQPRLFNSCPPCLAPTTTEPGPLPAQLCITASCPRPALPLHSPTEPAVA